MNYFVVHKFKKKTRIWKQGYFIGEGFYVAGIEMLCKWILHGEMPSSYVSKTWRGVTCKKCLKKKQVA